jgi:hypothetical protein
MYLKTQRGNDMMFNIVKFATYIFVSSSIFDVLVWYFDHAVCSMGAGYSVFFLSCVTGFKNLYVAIYNTNCYADKIKPLLVFRWNFKHYAIFRAILLLLLVW